MIMDALLEGVTFLDTFGIVEELRRAVLEFVRERGLERRDGWWPSLPPQLSAVTLGAASMPTLS